MSKQNEFFSGLSLYRITLFMFKSFFIILLCLFSILIQAKTKEITLKSGKYQVGISEKLAWTINTIKYDGKIVGLSNGFYGTVIRAKPGNTYIGTGHHEGGKELIKNIALRIDDKAVEIETGKVYTGNKLVLTKESMIDKLAVSVVITLTPNGITEHLAIIPTAEQPIVNMYAFMYPFSQENTKWIASNDKNVFSGKLLNSKGWKLLKNIKWLALYNPKDQLATIVSYPEVYRAKGIKNGIWDLPRYHKFYFQPFLNEKLPKGEKYSWTINLKCIEAVPDKWQQIVKKLTGADQSATATVPMKSIPLMPNELICPALVDSVLFYAPYDGEYTPRFAAAGNSCERLDFGKLEYVPGIRKQAVVIGEKASAFRYPRDKNIDLRRGTLSLWVKPLDWTGKDKLYHFLFRTDNIGKSMLMLYKNIKPNVGMAWFIQGWPKKVSLVTAFPIFNWQPGEWHHLAVTWFHDKYSLFIDGKEVQKRTFSQKLDSSVFGPDLIIGNSYKQQKRSAIDEVIVLNRALDKEEVIQLFQAYISQKTKKSDKIKSDVPYLALGAIKAPPVIDGQFSTKEWQWANEITGFTVANGSGNILLQRQTQVWMTWSGNQMYLAFRSKLPESGKLRTNVKNRDGQVFRDDSIEIYFQPDRNSSEMFHFIGNSANAIYDSHYQNGRGDINWNGSWQYANSVKDGWWTTELSFDFTTLKIKPGKSFGIRLCRDWQGPLIFSSWSPGKSFGDISTFGIMKLVQEAPAIQINSIAGLFGKGKVTLPVNIGNRKQTNLELSAKLKLTGLNKVIATKTVKVSLPSRKFKRIMFETILPEVIADVATLEIRTTSGSVWYRRSYPMRLETNFRFKQATNNSKKFWFENRYYPTLNFLETEIDTNSYKKLDAVIAAKIIIKDSTSRTTHTFIIDKFSNQLGKNHSKLPKLAPGKYKIIMQLLDKNGKLLVSELDTLEIQKRPEWLGAKLGVSDKVLPPFTPLIVNGNSVSCWGRKYGLYGLALPKTIVSAGKEILSAPVTINGKALSGSIVNIKDTSAQAVFSGKTKLSNGTLQAKLTAEYDGLLLYDLTAKGKFNELVLEIPLKPEYAKYFHYVADSGKANSDAGALPSQQGRVFDSRKVFKSAIKGSFIPYIWLGDDKRGIAWFADSYRGWVQDDSLPAIEIVRKSGEVLMIVRFIAKPVNLKQARTFQFGLMATPVRPLPKKWRSWTFRPLFPYNFQWGNKRIFWPCFYQIPRVMSLRSRDDATTRKLVETDHAKGIKSMPYIDITAIGKNVPAYRYFKHEWTIRPILEVTAFGAMKKNSPYKIKSDNPDDFTYVRIEHQESVKDYLLWSIKNMIDKWDIDGVYFDQTYPIVNLNELTGSVWEKDGKLNPNFKILAMRDFMKRVATLFHAVGKDPIIVNHMSGTMVIPSFSFGNVALDGEHFITQIHGPDGYQKLLPFGKLMGEFYAKNYGMVPLLLPEIESGSLKTSQTRNMLAVLLLHDMLWWIFTGDQKEMVKVDKIKAAFGIGDSDVKFYPYWRQSCPAKTANNQIKASVYVKPGIGALIAMANYSNTNATASLKLNLKDLAFAPDKCKITNAQTGEKLKLKGTVISVGIKKYDFILILIKKE